MKIQQGGAISNLKQIESIKEISFTTGSNYNVEMWINRDCLSYLTLSEVLIMRDEITRTIKTLVLHND